MRKKYKSTDFTKAKNSGILKMILCKDRDVDNIEIILLGKIDPAPLAAAFGCLRTTDVVVTGERIAHIRRRHPQDYALFEKYGAITIESPDLILQDTKHTGTIFVIKHLPDTNLNVVLRLVLDADARSYKNSIMTFYRIRDKNLRKLKEKFPLLYKRE